MVGARIKPPLKRPTRQRLVGNYEAGVVWRCRQQHRPGAQHAPHFAEQQRHVNNVLECLAAPDEIE